LINTIFGKWVRLPAHISSMLMPVLARPSKSLLALLLWLFSFTTAHAAFLFDPALDWFTLQSEHFEIHYHDGEEALAKRAAEIAEQQYLETGRYLYWYPKQRVQVLLIDTIDTYNAGATPLPENTMLLFMPGSDDPTEDYDDWLAHLITHEYTHIVHLDKADGAYNNLRQIFGRSPLFFPNAYQPAWVIEGFATYRETRPGLRIGRGQSSHFRSLMRIEWEQGLKPLRQVNQPIVSWPGGVTRYLYGVYFFNFIRDRYGDKTIPRWINQYSQHLIPWGINLGVKQQYGKDMTQLWDEFHHYLDQQFQPLVDAVRQEGESQGERLSHSGHYTGYLRAVNGDLYYIRNDLLSPPQLQRINANGEREALMDIYGKSYDVSERGIVFNQRERQHNTNYFYEIYRADPNGQNIRQLTHGGRYTHVLWSGVNIIAVQQNGTSERIQLLDGSGKLLKTLWQGKPGEIVSNPALSKDREQLLASVWRPQSHWEIETLNLNSGTWQRLTNNSGDEAVARYSKDGKSIYFVADYEYGIFNIYRMSLTGTNLQRLSNDLHGIVEADEIKPGQLGYVGMHAQGQDIYRIAIDKQYAIHPATTAIPETTASAPPAATPSEASVASNAPKPYSALSRLTPTSWFPLVTVEEESNLYGFEIAMYDPLQRHSYGLSASYDDTHHWGVGQFAYLYDRYNPSVNLYFNRYVTRARLGYSKPVAWFATEQSAAKLLFPFLKRDYQLRLDLGIAHETTRLIESKINLIADQESFKVSQLAMQLNTRKGFINSINYAMGFNLRLLREDIFDVPSVNKPAHSLDWRYYKTLSGNHSLAARVFRAKSDTNDPYQLGGAFAGYYAAPVNVPTLTDTFVTIHQRDYALRGYPDGLSQLNGSDVSLVELEYRFPIASIERGFMAPPIGINRIHGSVFVSSGNAKSGSKRDDIYSSYGIEFKHEVVLGYFFPLLVEVGYAKGVSQGGEDSVYGRLSGSF